MKKFNPNDKKLIDTLSQAIEEACSKLDFPLNKLNWFNYDNQKKGLRI
jgi:hypothetical protein